jgi:hypothetical protein
MESAAKTGAGAAGTGTTSQQPLAAKSIVDYLSVLQSGSSLSREGEEYVERVADALRKSNREVKVIAINGTNYESRLLEVGGYHVAFLFEETYMPGASTLPTAAMFDDVCKKCATRGITSKLLWAAVISKKDYQKVDTMGVHVSNLFSTIDRPQLKDVSLQLFQGSNFHITTDTETIRRYIDQMNPFASTPRTEVGILVYATSKETNMFQFGKNNQETQIEPILAMGGYTKFVQFVDGGAAITPAEKYTPLFTFTSFWSKLNTVPMQILGLCLGVDVLIRQNRWLAQFSNYASDANDLGMLITDKDTGKPMHCKDQNDRNAILANFMTTDANGVVTPVVALDLQLGHAVVPGMNEIFGNRGLFTKLIDDFTGGNSAASVAGADGLGMKQVDDLAYDGVIEVGGAGAGFMDTRCVDYLSLVASGAQPANVKDFRKFYLNSPDMNANLLRSVYPNQLKLRYITYRTFLNPEWIDAISIEMSKVFKFQVDGAMEVSAFNISTLKTFAPRAYGAGAMFQSPFPTGNQWAGTWLR